MSVASCRFSCTDPQLSVAPFSPPPTAFLPIIVQRLVFPANHESVTVGQTGRSLYRACPHLGALIQWDMLLAFHRI